MDRAARNRKLGENRSKLERGFDALFDLADTRILRGDEPPVEVVSCRARRQGFETVAPGVYRLQARLAHLIETRARQRLQEEPTGACKCAPKRRWERKVRAQLTH